jgi:hypothetical protein
MKWLAMIIALALATPVWAANDGERTAACDAAMDRYRRANVIFDRASAESDEEMLKPNYSYEKAKTAIDQMRSSLTVLKANRLYCKRRSKNPSVKRPVSPVAPE